MEEPVSERLLAFCETGCDPIAPLLDQLVARAGVHPGTRGQVQADEFAARVVIRSHPAAVRFGVRRQTGGGNRTARIEAAKGVAMLTLMIAPSAALHSP